MIPPDNSLIPRVLSLLIFVLSALLTLYNWALGRPSFGLLIITIIAFIQANLYYKEP